MKRANRFFAMVAMASLSAAATADWQVAESSQIGYVSVKNSALAENNTISGVTGSLTDTGALSIALDLTTVDTGIGIRNERMQQMLFEVFDYGTAGIEAQLTAEQIKAIAGGQAVRASLPVAVSLHGTKKQLTGQFLAIPTADGVVVTTTAPILVNAGDFGLEKGVAALQEIAGLAAISRAVPVTVDLLLTPAS